MHFDEVYHARTATEFLQDWRYGMSHDIYEWTHPHLAKYAMAGGLVLWGEDHVSAPRATSGRRSAPSAIEPRRVDDVAPGERAGERLHVATGTEIRTYDLRTRQLIATIAAPGRAALAIDATATSWSSATTTAGSRRSTSTSIGLGGRRAAVEPTEPLATRRPPRRRTCS